LSRLVGLASERVGGGVAASLLDLLVMEQLQQGQVDLDLLLCRIDPPPQQADKVREALTLSLQVRMPILRRFGVF
jgi:hypothetical protein